MALLYHERMQMSTYDNKDKHCLFKTGAQPNHYVLPPHALSALSAKKPDTTVTAPFQEKRKLLNSGWREIETAEHR